MQFAGYEIRQELARGGMGVVYRAWDPRLGREVALKLLTRTSEAAAIRFQREATALARLRHPHVVPVHSAGVEVGQPYLVMDLIPGESLGARLEREGPLAEDDALRLCLTLARALAHVHGEGLLHRDVKPDNILLRDGEPLLTDFGLARVLDEAQSLTRTGAFLGTPGFAAPEQAMGDKGRLGPAADVFGLGATLFALVTGVAPFAASSITELLASMQAQAPKPSDLRPGLSSGLDALCRSCLQPDPSERYADMDALAEDLERLLAGESPSASGAGRARARLTGQTALLVGLTLVALLAVGVAVGVVLGDDPTPATPQPEPADRTSAREPRADPRLERALELLEHKRYEQALDRFDRMDTPPPGPVLEATLPQVDALLAASRPERVLTLLKRPAPSAALRHADLFAGERRVLAEKALEQADAISGQQHRRRMAAKPELLELQTWFLEVSVALGGCDVPRAFVQRVANGAPLLARSREEVGRLLHRIVFALAEVDPENAFVQGKLASALDAMPPRLDPRSRIPILRRAMRLNPDPRQRHGFRMTLYRGLFEDDPRNPELAKVLLELVNDPEVLPTAEIAGRCADILAVQDRADEAMQLVDAQLERTPKDELWRVRRACLLWHGGEHQAALEECVALLAELRLAAHGPKTIDDSTFLVQSRAADRALRIVWKEGRERHVKLLERWARILTARMDGGQFSYRRPWYPVLAWAQAKLGDWEAARRTLGLAARDHEEASRDEEDRVPAKLYRQLDDLSRQDPERTLRALQELAARVRVQRALEVVDLSGGGW